MIDQFGNKIQPKEKSETDPKTTLAELNFMMKGFRKNQSVPIAMSIAKKLTAITKNDEILTLIEEEISEILKELEVYSAVSGSDDLCWELVYSLRNLSIYNAGLRFTSHSSHYRQRSAMLFESICKFMPTAYNKCCKVLEFTIYASHRYLSDTESESNKIFCLDILKREEEYFRQISEASKIYYKAGRNLYKNMYFMYKYLKDTDNCFRAARETAYYSREIYLLDKSDVNLEQYLNDYAKYAVTTDYPYSENKEEFNEAMRLAEEYNQRLNTAQTNKLLTIYKKLYNLLTSI